MSNIITIAVIGKVKDKDFRKKIEEYVTRCRLFGKVRFLELKNEAAMSELNNVYILDERGKETRSEEFAKLLENSVSADISFVIGDAQGFSDEAKSNYKNKIALSKMTLPHEFALTILAEQVYRGLTILKGHPYHKD